MVWGFDQVIEAPRANGKPVEMEPKAPVCVQDSTVPLETSESYTSQKTSLRTSDNTKTMNHEDTLEVRYSERCYTSHLIGHTHCDSCTFILWSFVSSLFLCRILRSFHLRRR